MAEDARLTDRPSDAPSSLRAIVDALPHITWLAEADGTMVVNHRWRDYTGCKTSTLEDYLARIHPDDLGFAHQVGERRAKGEPYEYHVRLRRADGVYRWHHVRATPFRRRPDEALLWIGTTTDVHDERTKEWTLRLLLRVHEGTRSLAPPRSTIEVALRELAEALGSVRCAFGDVSADGDTFTIVREWPLSAPPLFGAYRLSDFGERVVREQRAGDTTVFDDVRSVFPPETAAGYEALGWRACVCAPLLKDGRLIAMLGVHSSSPRAWAAEEVEAVRLVANVCGAEVERAKAEALAEERTAGARALVEANPIGVAVVDLVTDKVTDANDAWLRALGRTRDELTEGRIDWRSITPPESIAISEARVAEARRTGSTGLYEKEYLHADGSRVPVLVGFTPLDAEVRRATAFMLDLSDLRQAQEAAQEGERRYRILAESIPAIAFSLLPDGQVETVNARGEAFFGAENARRALDNLAHTIARGEAFSVERTLMGADREYRWFLCRAEPMREADGTIVRWIGTLTDIHEAKSRERLLRFLVDLDDAIAVLDDPTQAMRETAYMVAGAVGADRCAYAEVHADEEHFTILGDYARNGPSIAGLYRLDAFGERYAEMQRAGETYVVADAQAFGLSSESLASYGATNIAAVICVPVVKAGRLVAMVAVHQMRAREWTQEEIGLVEQVTRRSWVNIERVRNRRALRESEERLRDANEGLERKVADRTADLQAANDALQGFTYHVSHDLRTPLRAIVSTSRMVQQDYGDTMPPEAFELLDRQAEAGRKLGQLIDDLLQLSRLSSGELTKSPIDLTTLARDAAVEALSVHPETTVRIDVDDDLCVRADPRLLRLAVVNLLENAVKYSPQGGTVRLSAAEGGFKVTDEGIGMESKYLERIFEPFQRLHRDDEFKGTGIGLANVRRVVERHGGRVWAESELGKGSTFLVKL